MAPAPASLASASLAALRQAVVVARTARMKRRRRSSLAAPSLAAEANYHCWLLSVAVVPSLLVARTAQMKMRRMRARPAEVERTAPTAPLLAARTARSALVVAMPVP